MQNIIEIENLKKSFKNVVAVDDISFNVQKASLFAFLGINGAGKSTTINILCTLLKKDNGKVKIDGLDLDKSDFDIKNKIGIVFQNSILDSKLSVKENLKIRASYYGISGTKWKVRLKEISDLFSLSDILKRPYGKLSGGQKRRVDIARGLINYPSILFLDEPTTGLDPQNRKMIWQIIETLRKNENITIFLTTHYMEEAEQANQVVIIDSGKIIANDTPSNLKKKYSGNYIKIYKSQNETLDEILKAQKFDYIYENGFYKVMVKDSKQAMKFLIENENSINNFEVIKGNMDDVFLNATGKELEV